MSNHIMQTQLWVIPAGHRPSPSLKKNASHDGNDYRIPKKTQYLYSKHEDDPDVDYDDEIVDDFVLNVFDPK